MPFWATNIIQINQTASYHMNEAKFAHTKKSEFDYSL